MSKKSKYIVFIITILLVSSCSGHRFTHRVRKNENQEEIIAFKGYLLKINAMDDFKEFKKITPSETDSVILNFCRKYDIRSIYIVPASKYDNSLQSFKNSGDVVKMYYNNMYFFEADHSLIFDYSLQGLELVDELETEKYKITDRVFMF